MIIGRLDLDLESNHFFIHLHSFSQLIQVAKRGDRDPEAMKIADFWLKVSVNVLKIYGSYQLLY